MVKPKAKYRKNVAGILPRPLLRQIEHIQRLAREAGFFLHDRELLHCRKCGLLEDVDNMGQLITYNSGHTISDTGLRFMKGKGHKYLCPACGAITCEDVE